MSAYPHSLPVEVTGFSYCDDVHLTRSIDAVRGRKGEDAYYVLGRSYWCTVTMMIGGKKAIHPILVPRGFLTDLSTAPRLARALVSRVGPHLEASVVHDWLYVAWQHEGIKATDEIRLFADDVFLAAMKAAKVKSWRRWLIYRACRCEGESMFYEDGDRLFVESSPAAQAGDVLAQNHSC